jgi:hypothetical protein
MSSFTFSPDGGGSSSDVRAFDEPNFFQALFSESFHEI